jgi:hypothetical protein
MIEHDEMKSLVLEHDYTLFLDVTVHYFRLLLIGYFEGLDAERGIAWRANDSLAVRSFLRLFVGRGRARSLDDFPDAALDRPRDAPRGVHVGTSPAGGAGVAQGQDGRDRCDHAPRRMRRCAVS